MAGMLTAGLLLALAPLAASALTVEMVASFDPVAGELPEGMAVDRKGNVYLSMSFRQEVYRVTPEGDVSPFAAIPLSVEGSVAGLRFDKRGDLYVVTSSFTNAADKGVWKVSRDGTVSQVATLASSGFPNDLAFDDRGVIYVTDSWAGAVWAIDKEGDASLWFQDDRLLPDFSAFGFGADGLAFNRNGKTLYVNNLDAGRIIAVSVNSDGSAGPAEVFVEDPRLVGADGMTFDAKGNLYVAVNPRDRLAVVSPEGQVSVLAEGYPTLDGPAAVAFGAGRESKTLYIANFAVFRALGFIPGEPVPTLTKADIGTPGAPLP